MTNTPGQPHHNPATNTKNNPKGTPALRSLKTIATATVPATIVAAVALAAVQQPDFGAIDPFVDVHHLLEQNYYKTPDMDELTIGAIDGMLETLGDPYTTFIPQQDVADFEKSIRGQFVGIGARVRPEEGFVLIHTPMPASPALKAGIHAKDLIVAVDGVSTHNLFINQVIDMLTGEPGTIVRLTIERNADRAPENPLPPTIAAEVEIDEYARFMQILDESDTKDLSPDDFDEPITAPGPADGRTRFDIEITRGAIVTPTVAGIHREGESWTYDVDPERDIAYVRLDQFTDATPGDLAPVLVNLKNEGLAGLVLDLRFNSGGSLQAATAIANMFLEGGDIVTVKGRTSGEETHSARKGGTILPSIPMVVLVNTRSASASEILSGSLSDNGRAVIVGERSFGKGLVQVIYPLHSGKGQLKITQAYYYLPSGRLLHREDDSTAWGVDPTDGFYVPMTNEQYTDMLEVQSQEGVILPPGETREGDWSDPAWIEEHLMDPQLSAAVEAITIKVDTGEWEPTGQPASDGGIELKELRLVEQSRDAILRQLEKVDERIAALQDVATEDDLDQDERDLWDDEIVTEGGSITVTDAQGNVIATLNITGDTIERWLADAPVELEAANTGNTN